MSSEIQVSMIPEILDVIDKERSQIIPCFLGAPGIGKTQSIHKWAKDNGRNVVELILSQCLPSEISGITMPDKQTNTMQVYDSAKLASLKDGDVLFLDELLEAPPMVMSACLTLLQERRMMSGRKLPDVLIVAAANKTQSPSSLKMNFRQRFLWFDVEDDDFDSWKDYIEKNYSSGSVLKELSNFISVKDQSEWNQLTPRSMTKMIDLTTKVFSEEGCDSEKDIMRVILNAACDDNRVVNNIIQQVTCRINEELILKDIAECATATLEKVKADEAKLGKEMMLEEIRKIIEDNITTAQIKSNRIKALFENNDELMKEFLERAKSIEVTEVLS